METETINLIYDARGNGGGGISPTITGDHQDRITDYTAIVLTMTKTYTENRYGDYRETDQSNSIRASGATCGGGVKHW